MSNIYTLLIKFYLKFINSVVNFTEIFWYYQLEGAKTEKVGWNYSLENNDEKKLDRKSEEKWKKKKSGKVKIIGVLYDKNNIQSASPHTGRRGIFTVSDEGWGEAALCLRTETKEEKQLTRDRDLLLDH